MRRAVVAKTPTAAPARLNLAPCLRCDETLCSWLERFGAAYAMTLGEFLRWLGYRNVLSYGTLKIDVDTSPPADLVEALASHAGVSSQLIEAHRLDGPSVLPARLRYAFCIQCWEEDGPYLHREWASGWSLICAHHRSLLSERPHIPPPSVSKAEDLWLSFYETPRLWRNRTSCWESEIWFNICNALGVNSRTEATRMYFWLRDFQRLARTYGGIRDAQPAVMGSDSDVERWVVKRDLMLYGTIKFFGHEPSLLQALDPSIPKMRFYSGYQCDVCGIASPEADYHIRLFAAVVAAHLWERLISGRWRCRHKAPIEEVLQRTRWSGEDWWLERRLFSWPARFQGPGRELFYKQDCYGALPPWSPCRHTCVRHTPRDCRDHIVIRLNDTWRCSWNGPDDARDWVPGRRWQSLGTGTSTSESR